MKTITIIGNLGANAVRRTMSDGREFMTFNVAVSAGDSAVWFNCIGNVREKLLQYLVKGQCVCVVGDLQARTYNGNLDLSVNIDRIELCGKAPESEDTTTTAES
jgi:single-stranded DNA-binding protein